MNDIASMDGEQVKYGNFDFFLISMSIWLVWTGL